MVNVDWIVAIGLFLVFIVWSFSYYAQLFAVEGDVVEAMELISERVLANLTVKVHSIPFIANISNVSVSNAVLYFEYRWPFGKNTTKMVKDGSSQTCNITGNVIYWRSNLAANNNYFTMKYSDQNANLSCSGGFTVVNETQVIPFAVEEGSQISRARINGMNATNYSDFKAFLGLTRDFNITIENATQTILSYGLQPPEGTDVFSKSILGRLEDTEENVTIRFLAW